MSITYRVGNALEASEPILLQQCNCTSLDAKGFAKDIIDTFAWGDLYSGRAQGNKRFIERPGTMTPLCPPEDNKGPIIACLMGQFGPGKPKASDWDTREHREKWFTQGLVALSMYCLEKLPPEYQEKANVAVPFKIGCGLGGGEWSHYVKMFEACIEEYPWMHFVIYTLPKKCNIKNASSSSSSSNSSSK